MVHHATEMTRSIAIGATRRSVYDLEIVSQDGGGEVRNLRSSKPRITYEVALPPAWRSNVEYQSVLDLFEATRGGVDSFNFHDWVTGDQVCVRFDGDLQITSPAGHLDTIETMTLIEVRDVPSATIDSLLLSGELGSLLFDDDALIQLEQ